MNTLEAIIPCPDCDHGSDHALVCLGEGPLALFDDYGKALHECDEHKGRKPIELTRRTKAIFGERDKYKISWQSEWIREDA